MPLRVLYIGEIVGKPGIFVVKQLLPGLRQEFNPDVVIANADGATNGFGLGRNHAMYLRKLGVQIITGGDQLFFKKDIVPAMDQLYHVVRPANLPPGAPGRGWRTIPVTGKGKFAVLSLLGQPGFHRIHAANPFGLLPELVRRIKAETAWVVVDFHSVTTAEKAGMNLYADGLVSAVIGSGLRCLMADHGIGSKGTAFLSDAGRTGSLLSVNGFDPGPEIQQFMTSVPERSQESWLGLELQGCVIDLDDSGKATAITALRRPCAARPEAGKDETPADQATEAEPEPEASEITAEA